MNRINAFILAAGLGDRLLPITAHLPKPLIPVLGKPVIEHVLDRLSSLPLNQIGINLHYKKEVIEAWASTCFFKDKINLFPEKKMLGTGGALKNASELLGQTTFLVHNSDILTNINLEELLDFHIRSKNLVTLSAHEYPEFNKLVIDTEGFLKYIKQGETLPPDKGQVLAFTGVAVYEPAFLDYLPEGESNVVDIWLDAVNDDQRVGIYQTQGHRWCDIGTPETYASALFEKLMDEGEMLYLHPSSHIAALDIEGYAVIERECDIRENVKLRNCILLPDCKIGNDAGTAQERPNLMKRDDTLQIENCIVGPDFLIKLDDTNVAALYGKNGKQLIGAGGSDRRYYRVKEGNKTSVLMQCSNDDTDFERHIEYTRFFLDHAIPVPALISSDPVKSEAYFEDGGDSSLYTYLKCHFEYKETESLYKKVLDALLLIHTKATENVSCCPLLEKRIFDYDHFRWETAYFIENFLRVQTTPSLKEELHKLACKADSFPKTIIHRDFQSQNIMVVKGDKILIIDYQGARIGPPAYDLASLLWDPYSRLDDGMREHLAGYYIDQMKRLNPTITHGDQFDEKAFRESLLTCRLQRHMQALGAYGFLSSKKGKKYFLRYVPEGLHLLKEDISLSQDEYPALYKLIMSCH